VTTARPEGRLVGRIAGSYALAETYHMAALREEMETVTALVSSIVPDAIGLDLPGHPQTVIVTRHEWVQRNTDAFGHMLEPARRQLEERLARKGRSASPVVIQGLMQKELEAILALLSRRVLGQYELVLPSGESGDMVAYVGANILQLERKHHFRPSEFRFWVALHELTHRAQFQGVPWLRGYFMGLVAELVEMSRPEPGRLGRVLDEMGERRSAGLPLVDERGLFGLFATPSQNAVVDKVQALMSLLEGHGHVVMDRVGAIHLKSTERMSRVLKGRRHDRRAAAFLRMTGLEMKLKQYRQGEAFVKGVDRTGGWETLNLAFRGPESLPTLDEIEHPGKWLERVA
jgi:coenzyme F420 biosynthesis associated uncharacterized protein